MHIRKADARVVRRSTICNDQNVRVLSCKFMEYLYTHHLGPRRFRDTPKRRLTRNPNQQGG